MDRLEEMTKLLEKEYAGRKTKNEE